MRIESGNVSKTAFRMRYGHYKFLVMSFGLTNEPAAFMDLLNWVLRPFVDRFVMVLIDDIWEYSRSEEEHVMHLRFVLQTLRKHHLYVKFSKCKFWLDQVAILGHVIFKDGIQVRQKKIGVIIDWSRPITVTEVKGFSGFSRLLQENYEGFLQDRSAFDKANPKKCQV